MSGTAPLIVPAKASTLKSHWPGEKAPGSAPPPEPSLCATFGTNASWYAVISFSRFSGSTLPSGMKTSERSTVSPSRSSTSRRRQPAKSPRRAPGGFRRHIMLLSPCTSMRRLVHSTGSRVVMANRKALGGANATRNVRRAGIGASTAASRPDDRNRRTRSRSSVAKGFAWQPTFATKWSKSCLSGSLRGSRRGQAGGRPRVALGFSVDRSAVRLQPSSSVARSFATHSDKTRYAASTA
mmetsp:Transcript_18738/g.70895  ORF Transcript_18738/g.70895 Transcript_18738/m.70895 type:complete len:239 (-) Transcript_18738:395-1111(-)